MDIYKIKQGDKLNAQELLQIIDNNKNVIVETDKNINICNPIHSFLNFQISEVKRRMIYTSSTQINCQEFIIFETELINQ
jgi:hypothetical protein